MPRSDPEDQLAGSRQVVLVLRLVLDREAGLKYGELIDADAVRQGRFASLAELADAVKQLLARQRQNGTAVLD